MFYYTVDRIVKSVPIYVGNHARNLITFTVGTCVWGSLAYLLWNPRYQSHVEANKYYSILSMCVPIFAIFDMFLITVVENIHRSARDIPEQEQYLLQEEEYQDTEDESRIATQFSMSSALTSSQSDTEVTQTESNTTCSNTTETNTYTTEDVEDEMSTNRNNDSLVKSLTEIDSTETKPETTTTSPSS